MFNFVTNLLHIAQNESNYCKETEVKKISAGVHQKA